ncbi:MAG: L-rhamnose isomerase [Candidatus Enteromonas sp.]|nr:L-rhamnose isomerase [Candidatus Enteromonas sp.]
MKKSVIDAFGAYGIDPRKAIRQMKDLTVSIHCWQLDDVSGFESSGQLTGGIQSTGDHFGKARNFEELTADLDEALSHIPGNKKINLHAIYQAGDHVVDRAEVGPEQFVRWVEYAKARGLGLDYNPTCFSSPMVKEGLTLSSPDPEVRAYWVKHCQNSIKVAEYFGEALGKKSLCNIWVPDGLKEAPADRRGPRERLKESLDEILSVPFNRQYADVSVESKVFGIGVESYTVGSHEFYMGYALKNNVLCLLDTGHFHPTEVVADKISSLLLYSPRLALHVSRPVRWDSDHVLKLDDNLQEVADELVKNSALKKTYVGLDYFDGSLNRVAAIVIGSRNMYKAVLKALLTPWGLLKEAQDTYDHTKQLMLQEEIRDLPYAEVWKEYCRLQGVEEDASWYEKVAAYERDVLAKRS